MYICTRYLIPSAILFVLGMPLEATEAKMSDIDRQLTEAYETKIQILDEAADDILASFRQGQKTSRAYVDAKTAALQARLESELSSRDRHGVLKDILDLHIDLEAHTHVRFHDGAIDKRAYIDVILARLDAQIAYLTSKRNI